MYGLLSDSVDQTQPQDIMSNEVLNQLDNSVLQNDSNGKSCKDEIDNDHDGVEIG